MDTVMDGETADTGLQELRLTASTTGYIKVSLQQTEIHHGYGYGWRGSRHRSARIETHGKHYRLHQGFTATNRNTSWIRLWMERQRTQATSRFHCNKQKYIMDTVMDGEAADTALQATSRFHCNEQKYIMDTVMDREAADTRLQAKSRFHCNGQKYIMDAVMDGEVVDTALQAKSRFHCNRQKYIMDTVMDGEAADTGLQAKSRFHCNGQKYIMDTVMDGEAADTGLQVLRLKASTTGYINVSLQQTEMHCGYGYGWRGSGHRSAGSETHG
ncbi:hypothetical protein J6590_064071 [Homalodisca vitripennis]|nr:hypothetical protein J6590_064071 [Homalodisca vitripennis]